GENRLFSILMTESAYIIWKMRCEWRISREGNIQVVPTTEEVRNRWIQAIENRSQMDIVVSMNSLRYKRKALSPRGDVNI
ncbi:hypothetical protein BU17DRAFT_59037, partial [Hysterangium stoloniferum]